jgi:hypothetical protein
MIYSGCKSRAICIQNFTATFNAHMLQASVLIRAEWLISNQSPESLSPPDTWWKLPEWLSREMLGVIGAACSQLLLSMSPALLSSL